MDALATYIVSAMLTWVPVDRQFIRENGKLVREPEAQVMARYNSIAEDISAIAQDPQEEPLWTDPNGRVKTALLLAAVASLESAFQKFVDDGTCNDPTYVADGRGNCDGRSSWTIFQIKPHSGLIFRDRWMTLVYDKKHAERHPEEVWTGKKLIADRRAATRVALHLMRYSFDLYGSLCAYTGESCKTSTSHPLANNRTARALDYFKAHPFVVPVL